MEPDAEACTGRQTHKTAMFRARSGSAVPREHVFVLVDGTRVVQWREGEVQDLYTGRTRAFADADYGHAITDFELSILKDAGLVEAYNARYVWLSSLPERQRFSELRVQERSKNRVRGFYFNTTLPESELPRVQRVLEEAGLAAHYRAVSRGGVVAVVNIDRVPLLQLDDAERALQQIQAAAPELLGRTVVAFVDLPAQNGQYRRTGTSELHDLAAVIASQTDTRLTAGRRAVVVCRSKDETQAISRLLADMRLETQTATGGQQALDLLRSHQPHLLVMDLQLADMHGWQLLAHAREIVHPDSLLTVVLADRNLSSNGQAFGLGVVKVSALLTRPVSMARLRQAIWQAFQRQSLR
nr:MAG: hypothetical protein DIU68_12615 [Chloroflexota bacterium]